MARTPRYRLRYTFWLNHLNRDEEQVADTIERLKSDRSFSTVVRDGIMIVSELRQGRADTLLKLYPWIADIGKSKPSPDTDELRREIADLKKMLVENGNIVAPPENYPLMKSTSSKALDVPKLSKPLFDDDDLGTLVFKKSETAATDASTNFFNQIAGYVQPAGHQ